MQISKSYRSVALILAGIIAISSLGMSVSVHYCQGHLSGVSLLLPKHDKAGCHTDPSAETKKSCCESSLSDERPCCSDKSSTIALDYDGPSTSISTLVDLDYAKVFVDPVASLIPSTKPCIDASGLDPPDDVFPSGQNIRIALSSFLC